MLGGTAGFELEEVDDLEAVEEFVEVAQSTKGIVIGSPNEARKVMRNTFLLS